MYPQTDYGFDAPMAPIIGVNPDVQGAAVTAQGNPVGNDPYAQASAAGVDLYGRPVSPGFAQPGGMLQMGIGAISTLGNLWNSFQQNKLAKKSLGLQTRAFETNLANQTKTYNTSLEGRIAAQYKAEGRSDSSIASDTRSYVDKNKL